MAELFVPLAHVVALLTGAPDGTTEATLILTDHATGRVDELPLMALGDDARA